MSVQRSQPSNGAPRPSRGRSFRPLGAGTIAAIRIAPLLLLLVWCVASAIAFVVPSRELSLHALVPMQAVLLYSFLLRSTSPSQHQRGASRVTRPSLVLWAGATVSGLVWIGSYLYASWRNHAELGAMLLSIAAYFVCLACVVVEWACWRFVVCARVLRTSKPVVPPGAGKG